MSVISIAHGAPEPEPEPVFPQVALVQLLVAEGIKAIIGLSKGKYENDAMQCFFNDWKARDSAAQAYCTYNGGRFSKDRKFWGITIGRWYCTMKKDAFEALGHSAHC